ncbi:shikimate dehydrogenase [Specibacter sp. RAF43]|uniref:shikimate dehydrogenase n=1 Tax=Specibacter sp. RAF43 TaxID=3233057 RepID=UPI003F964B87
MPALPPVPAGTGPLPGATAGSPALRGAVLGHPIGHSRSPALHRAAYGLLGLNYSYAALDVTVPELAGFIGRVRSDGDWYGLSVTMPLKNAVVPLLDELTPVARVLGAVNTVAVTRLADGGLKLVGANTDVAGIVQALRHAGAGERPRAAVLGGGGTAVSAVAALAELEAAAIDVYVRDPGRAAGTQEVARQLGVASRLAPFTAAAPALPGYDVVISTLPPHGADALARELGDAAGTAGRFLLDVAYDPWPSALAAAWAAGGGTVVAGIEMLLYQAAEQVRLFTAAGGPGATGRAEDVINVMCDAIGLPRRQPHR